MPSVVTSNTPYTLELYIINQDPSETLTLPIDIYYSIDGRDDVLLVSGVVPPKPIVSGDSFLVSIGNFNFNQVDFLGGGGGGSLNHTIIVWPMRVGVPPQGDDSHQFQFQHDPDEVCQSLAITPPHGLPDTLIPGETYDMTFEVLNTDIQRPLLHPVDIWYSVNGESSHLLGTFELSEPLMPLTSVSVQLPPSALHPVINALGGGGGGSLNHTIIVWPMSWQVDDLDSLEHEIVVGEPATDNIELSTPFNAEENDEGEVSLTWRTSSEPGEVAFEVTSETPGNAPKTSARVQGQGNAESGYSYEITIANPSQGWNRFQLFAELPDGSRHKLGQTNLLISAIDAQVITHEHGSTSLNISLPQTQSAEVSVFDSQGRKMLSRQVGAGMTSSIDLTFLPTGTYAYQVLGTMGSKQAIFTVR
ncbi:hypothetical protein [Pontibacter sp. G13]|uniref:hypothetical protein n=1 Tax=Pontibacter sp. G13 TaxID=3074898 RepID=UPI00288BD0F8|nr:hypothetical protein [Pontibacter sp. G13]WNJ21177.1 hypothetical protein RJD25_11975 [Pontibacter sp. G13]